MSKRLNRKVISVEKASKIVEGFRRKRKKVGFVTGVFDIIHMGHALFLKSIKDKVNVLVVGVDDNQTARKIKGYDQPFFDETERAELLSALEFVDYIFVFKGPCSAELLKQVNPHFYGVAPFDPVLKAKRKDARDARVKILISPHFLNSHSSSKVGRTLRFSYLMSRKPKTGRKSWNSLKK
jgi:D-beta-D-heptose 7-phosphate kinase/D-beta-D-heptose 1-phosphate adenosyltransferase